MSDTLAFAMGVRSLKDAAQTTTDPFGLGDGAAPITLAELERRYIAWVLEYTGDNKRRAAEILDIGRRTLYRKLE